MVTSSNAFVLPGHTAELSAGVTCWRGRPPAGARHQSLAEVCDLPDGRCKDNGPGRTELRPTAERELKMALSRDRVAALNNNDSDAALSPQEDLK